MDNTRFDSKLRAQVTRDPQQRVRQINHFDEYWQSEQPTARDTAAAYLRAFAATLDIAPASLDHVKEPASYVDPRQQSVQYRLTEEKTLFDATTLGFVQTVHNVPVWGAGVTVTVKHAPYRVVAAVDTSHDKPSATLPEQAAVERHVKLFAQAETERKLRESARLFPRTVVGNVVGVTAEASPTADFVRKLVGQSGEATPNDDARLIRGRLFFYLYRAAERLPRLEDLLEQTSPKTSLALPFHLPPVPPTVKEGEYRLVSEMSFAFRDKTFGDLVWLALVDVMTDAVLFLRALAAGVDGLVFRVDPITAGNPVPNDSSQASAVLNPFRSAVTLPNLNAPVSGTQSLIGARISISERETPTVAAPTEPGATNFDFDVRTNDFAAVNAYFHTDNLFQVIESLGFPLATYFSGTTFPLPVDHRGMSAIGNTINAHCVGNGTGGTDHVCFALGDTTDMVHPLGRATDSRVTWHELGGHGALENHVNFPNFGFAHSSGDSLSGIYHDPTSQAPDRFRYAPWNPINARRFDRDPAAGWAWGGAQDVGGYNSEEILSTCHFRIYRSIGGDSADIARRTFASRMMLYLILRAIGSLTAATNPANASAWANALMATDLLNWTSEGIFGGAYNKVIRWAFEKQGLYQPPGAPTPVTTAGAPPDVDVYIDDGRGGEYPFQPVHWATTTIWNRNAADGGLSHDPPMLGVPNYAYVKVKNRGTQPAHNVRVKGFHCKPSAGLLWPNDLQAMTTAEIVVGDLGPNNSEERIAGPFTWTPITNAFGHDCLMMMASADGDPSNIDNFTAGETIPEWRLVPNDNNIGQRNVYPVPAMGGGGETAQALHGMQFTVGNPNPKRATMELRAELPVELEKLGWKIVFRGLPENRFVLPSGGKADVTIEVIKGRNFTARQVKKMRTREVVVHAYADGLLVGGMTYPIDPNRSAAQTSRDPLKNVKS